MNTDNNYLFLNERTAEILTKIEKLKHENKNTFLLNLWKNYIIGKKESYLKILCDCEQFINTIERELENENKISSNNLFSQELSNDTIFLLYSLMNVVNNTHIKM